MVTKTTAANAGADRAREILSAIGRELRAARVDRGLSIYEVAKAAGVSAATVSRLERAKIDNASILELARLHAAVGLDLSVRSFPAGQPVRDTAQVTLLNTFRERLHPSLTWATEVPMPLPGDRRAWDATLRGPDFLYGVECETGPRDLQASVRRWKLKARDAGVDGVILLMGDTLQSRTFREAGAELLAREFPVDGSVALRRLAAGLDPEGSAMVVLKRAHRPTRVPAAGRPRGTGKSKGAAKGVAANATKRAPPW